MNYISDASQKDEKNNSRRKNVSKILNCSSAYRHELNHFITALFIILLHNLFNKLLKKNITQHKQ